MWKISQTLTLCLLITAAYSQPTLLSSEMLPYGSVMTEKSTTDYYLIDTTIQGAGVVWNFTSLTHNTAVSDLVVNIVNPTSTPYTGNFPSANYGYKEVKGASTKYRYFNLSSSKMERVGSYITSVNVYSDPQVEYVFPLTLGTKNQDTWISSSGGGTYDLECIGSGTLNLPEGSSYNALMVRVRVSTIFYDLYAYYWYSSDNGAVLLSYIPGDGFFINTLATYLGSVTTGIEKDELIMNTKYNNPIGDNFKLSFQSKNNAGYSYTVMNSFGEIVHKGTSEVNNNSTETLNIDFSGFSAGIYFFVLRSEGAENGTKTIKIVKK